MFDSHSHFIPPQFSDAEIEETWLQRESLGLSGIVIVSEAMSDIPTVLRQRNGFYRACVGIHPVQESPHRLNEEFQMFQNWVANGGLDRSSVVGIGECGLDFSPGVLSLASTEHDKEEFKRLQIQVFKYQIDLANRLGLAVNVHSRNAGHHAIRVLRENQAKSVLLHAFDGRASHVYDASQNSGFYFSVPPSVTRVGVASPMTKWAVSIDSRFLMLESDSPALGPTKDSKNCPSNISLTLEWLSSRRRVSPAELDSLCTSNSKKLFQIVD